MTELRQRMLDAMLQRGLSPRTQESYVDAIYGMAKHYRRDPAQYSAQEVEAYLLNMIKESHLSYSTMNQAACAARFLYEKVLGHGRELFPIAMAKVPAKQPELLAREEIARLYRWGRPGCRHPAPPGSRSSEGRREAPASPRWVCSAPGGAGGHVARRFGNDRQHCAPAPRRPHHPVHLHAASRPLLKVLDSARALWS